MQPATQNTAAPGSAAAEFAPGVASQLARHINACWREAVTYKNIEAIEELLKCDRQRKGIYDPDVAQSIAASGGSDIYMMISDIKARAAASWIKDVIASAGDRPYDLTPDKNPQFPPEIAASIAEFVMMEAEPFLQEGQVHPEAMRSRMEEVRDQVMNRMREDAMQAAERMSTVIGDQMRAGGFEDALDAFIDDYTTYPTAILKGPVVRRKQRLGWGPEFQPIVVDELVRDTVRVSPYDIYPSPNSKGPDDGYLIERHRLTGRELQQKMGLPGYNSGEIAAAISKYGRMGLKYNEKGDFERAHLENKATYGFFVDQKMDVLEFWGPVQGMTLKDWGFTGKLDPMQYYEVNAWMVGAHVIRAVMNPDPLGRRPYHTASWRRIADSFWGESLMKIARDVQRMCNNAARALADNMGIASGPQVDVSIDRLPEGAQITDLYPWKVHQTTSDRTGSNQPAIRFYQPDMHSDKLLNVYSTFMRQADEVTGVPNYIYGSSQASGAGRTASGLAMLMDNAAKGIKMAIRGVDKAVSGVVFSLYIHNMLFHPDPYIKGAFHVTARGALGVLVKEQLRQARNEFMRDTNNPTDMQIIGMEGRAYMLRETAQELQMNTDNIVPTLELLRHKLRIAAQEAEQKRQEFAAQGLAADGITPLPVPPPQPQGQPQQMVA